MCYVNLESKGEKDIINLGARPVIGDIIIHPKWGHTKVINVVFDIHYKTKETSITVKLEALVEDSKIPK